MMTEYSKGSICKLENTILTVHGMQGFSGLIRAWLVNIEKLFRRFKVRAGFLNTDS